MPRPSEVDWPFTVMAWTEEFVIAGVDAAQLMNLYRLARAQKGEFMPNVQEIIHQWELYCEARLPQLQPTYAERMGLRDAEAERAAVARFQANEARRRIERENMIRAHVLEADTQKLNALLEAEVMDE